MKKIIFSALLSGLFFMSSNVASAQHVFVNDQDIRSGTSNDALQSMELIYKIYYKDKKWRQTYNISNPEIY